MSKEEHKSIITSTSEALNTKAGLKLTKAIAGLVGLPEKITNYVVGPERITKHAEVEAKNELIKAKTDVDIDLIKKQAEYDCLRIETGEFVYDREMRKTRNRNSIVEEAKKALPQNDDEVSDTPISDDFTHMFFEEFDGISDPEIHKIAGRLLAGEVTNPGTFPRRTMRVLRDLESNEFKCFASLCRFAFRLNTYHPIILDVHNPIYQNHGLSYVILLELDSLGLINFSTTGAFSTDTQSKELSIPYGSIIIKIELKNRKINLGQVALTDAGKRLLPLTHPQIIPELIPYVVNKWRSDGHKVDII